MHSHSETEELFSFEVSNYCANELHKMVAEEWDKGTDEDGWRKRWEVALCNAYGRADGAFKDKSLAPYSVGSTASIVILSPCHIIAANVGDSRVVLCRGKRAIPLTVDHKLEREDELARIRDKGGRIVQWGCLRVEGVLSMSRAIGDHGLKPWIISVPEVTFTPRTEDDEFLILASDGLWDVLSNDVAVRLAREEFRYQRRQPKKDDTSSHPPAINVAKELLKRAFTAYTCDNVSVVVVDLKLPRRRPHQKF
ncbi:hypothetical protein Patl1_33983 [Pistacia atlantica]|uniref:Uncharacterized protein n=1 Tax=Pistacia atlantica TaxID=434234 RepID=A0ACC0ZS84_9ROSI|nr:hypothetical protein Patl1_33983 [Pistacia atlantica]